MAGGKPRSKQHTPFDPEDLSRRLYVVIAEREANAERKKRAWAEADRRARSSAFGQGTSSKHSGQSESSGHPHTATGSGSRLSWGRRAHTAGQSTKPTGRGEDNDAGPYHHVPKVAASQFARTTTTVDPTEEKTLVHRLSRVAMKFHRDGIHDKEYHRNQTQQPPILEAPTEPVDRQYRLAQRHTFESEFINKSKGHGSHAPANPRIRMSTDAPAASAHLERQDSCDGAAMTGSSWGHRVDWTQSDEQQMPEKGPEPTQLRKSDSRWTLRGRLGSRGKTKDAAMSPADEGQSPPDSLAKSPKSLRTSRSSFFGRFKR